MESSFEDLSNHSNDDENNLLKAAYDYLVEGKNPENATKNEKRIIRRKATKLEVVDGVLYIKKKKKNPRNSKKVVYNVVLF